MSIGRAQVFVHEAVDTEREAVREKGDGLHHEAVGLGNCTPLPQEKRQA